MTQRKKAASTAAPAQHKDTQNLRYRKGLLLERMKRGEKFTACQINKIVRFNDARKFISDLRRRLLEYMVCDRWQPNGCKLYWLELCQAENNLFSKEGGSR